MIKYSVILTNITGKFFTSNFVTDVSIEKDINDVLKGSISFSSQVYVKNIPLRSSMTNKFIEPKSLTNLDINGGAVTSDAITNISNVLDKLTITKKFDSVGNKYEYTIPSLQNNTKVDIKELIGTSAKLNTYTSLLNMFKINDYLKIQIYKLNPELGKFEVISSVYIYVRNIVISDGTFTLELEGETYQLKKRPVNISTPIKGLNMLSFLESYIIYYLIKFTNVRSVIIKESDWDIFKKSNFGGYRSNVVSLYKIIETMNKDYNINIDYDGSGTCFISYGQVDRMPNVKKVINVIDGVYEYDLNNINVNDNPVIVRCSSTSQTRDIANKGEKVQSEVIYGDIEALSNGGTIQNFKTANLDKEGLTAFAKRIYSKQKYLSKVNGIFSKIPIEYSTKIYLNDNKNPYNTGWYFVNGTKLSLNNDDGLTCEVRLGIRFAEYDDVSKALNV
jgi:hypothetical protein